MSADNRVERESRVGASENPAPTESPAPTPESRSRASHAGEKPYSCGGCTTRWSGGGRAHCSGCHLTWNTATLFDRHRRLRGEQGICLDPTTMTTPDGPLRLLNGVWNGPEMPEGVLARKRGTDA